MKTWITMAVALVVVSLPAIAAACPYCAGNNNGSDAFFWVLGAMILLPFPTVAMIVYLINRAEQDESNPLD